MNESIDNRDYSELSSTLKLAQNVIYKEYLGHFADYNILLPGELLMGEEPSRCIRMFHLKQLTCKKNEDILQKLSTVYHSAMSLGCSVFLIIDSPGNIDIVNIYIGVRAPDIFDKIQGKALRTSYSALKKGIMSNFPGSTLSNISASQKIPGLLDDIFQDDISNVSAVSCVASIRDKDKTENKNFIQGIEKLIDTMHGKAYTGIFIAEPIQDQEQSDIRSGYQDIYSVLSSFRKSTWSYNASESNSVLNNISHGVSKTITEGVAHTQSHTLSHTKGTNNSYNVNINIGGSTTSSTSNTETTSKSAPTGVSRAGAAIKSFSDLADRIPNAAVLIPGIGPVLGVVKSFSPATAALGSAMQGSSITKGISETLGRSFGGSIGIGGGYTRGNFESDSESDGTSDTTNTSTSNGSIDTTSEGKTITNENGSSLQIEFTNKDIEEILKRTDEQLQRLQECEDYGAYSCGAYFLSNKEENSILAANTYKALLIGKGTSIERGAVTVWNDKDTVTVMKEYLRRFSHPVFAMPLGDKEKKSHMVQSPSTIVSGLELPLHLGLPFKSVVGLQVIDHAEFGRNVIEGEGNIKIGKLYHMGQIEKDNNVLLDKESLTKHTFITGSTGSGKSNTIYKMLDELINQDVNFLVIEPTKGEYKSVFGRTKGVITYGTNPILKDTKLLRINPFRFPKTTHILEHLDRLVEIFNVCWPMYAAMPAILKDSIERAYANCGWDLEKSKNRYDPELFPTFLDVVRQVK
ncbi:helicase HerA domain-containing protein, partial [Oribacterium sp. FC2011]|uniref:helicase HerA domain-containing protein n=1 Tax=Oribacterium sp. FC2011 TaxID=1408311 RepID=UPI0004E1E1F9